MPGLLDALDALSVAPLAIAVLVLAYLVARCQ